MKLLPTLLFICLACTSAAQEPSRERELRALQDSIRHWQKANPCDPLSDNLYMCFTTAEAVEAHFMRADSAVCADFRRRVHDSPFIRLRGFDPDREPWPAAPEGTSAPDTAATMRTEYALYPTGTAQVNLYIRSGIKTELSFGEEYTVCRFQNGRWEALPAGGIWNALLHTLCPGGTYAFTARLEPRVFPTLYGRYRICKQVETPDGRYLLTAEFTVTPFVPFTRFAEPTSAEPGQHIPTSCKSSSPAPKR